MPSDSRRVLIANDLKDKSKYGMRLAAKVEDCAESFADLLGLPLTYVYVADGMSHDLSHREVNERLDRLRHDPEVLVKSGDPAKAIADETLERPRTEVVVMGTRAKKGFEYLINGSVAENVIAQSSRPVVVVGPHVRTGHVRSSDLSILVATDLTDNSAAAEKYAIQLAKRFNSQLRFLFCLGDELLSVQDGVINSGYVNYDMTTAVSEIHLHAKTEIQSRLDRMKKLGIDAVAEIRKGAAVDEIARAAVRDTDLIVMGTHGRTHLASTFFGSTARATIQASTVPVVVVPTATKF